MDPPPASAATGFAERGIKGWAWTPDQYLETIPHLRQLAFTFLANCYASLADIEHARWGTPGCNRWWEPLPETKRRAYERVIAETLAQGLDFWFSMNPNLFAERFARASDPASIDALWRHYDWAQRLGVRTFNVALDDIGQGVDPADQARLVNAILTRLRRRDPGARMVFCPTIYWGNGRDPGHAAYLATIARVLDPDVRVFWTGDAVVTARITRRAAEGYRAAVGHDLVVWDNYPVNDDTPTMHLGAVVGRDPDLHAVAGGYMANPMHSQHRLGLLPLATSAEYAQSPAEYDPIQALERAIARFASTVEERSILRSLVELYPGMLRFEGANQYFNPVRARLGEATAAEREGLLEDLEATVDRFARALGERYPAELATLRDDLAWGRALRRSAGPA